MPRRAMLRQSEEDQQKEYWASSLFVSTAPATLADARPTLAIRPSRSRPLRPRPGDHQLFTEALRWLTSAAEMVQFPAAADTALPAGATRARAVYLQGLLGLQQKNAERIAYRHDEDRQGLQTFIGTSPWDHRPLLDELASQVARELGKPDGVLVFDPSAFAKKGKHSVGVARQWCGRLGKKENCQVGVFWATSRERNTPWWTCGCTCRRSGRRTGERCKAAGVPREEMRLRTRHELALEMLDSKGPVLPHAWIAGDDEMGRPAHFRRELADRGERYLLAVPSNTTIRDLEAEPPAYRGRGRRPKPAFQQVRKWCESLPASAWTRVEVRDAEKGPMEVEIVKRRVVAKIGRQDRSGGDAGRDPQPRRGAESEDRLPLVQRAGGHSVGRVRPRGQRRAPDRGVHQACQERGGHGAVPSAKLARLASSYHTLV